MEKRRLGRTGHMSSVIIMGTAAFGRVTQDEADAAIELSLAHGVNHIDVAPSYGDAQMKFGVALEGRREHVHLACKTLQRTVDGAQREFDESLKLLKTDHVDIYQFHALDTPEELETILGRGGAMETFLKAREQGLIRFIGVTGHSSMAVLTDAIKTGRFDTVLAPINFVQPEAFQTLIPTARAMDVGVIAMKPVMTGVLPTTLALKWLFQQPIATTVPGVSTFEQLTANVAAAEFDDWTLTPTEETQLAGLQAELEHRVCRGCDDLCRPFPIEVRNISQLIVQGVSVNHLRNLGKAGFLAYNWGEENRQAMVGQFERALDLTRRLLAAGVEDVEARCPYGVRVAELLQEQEARLAEFLGG